MLRQEPNKRLCFLIKRSGSTLAVQGTLRILAVFLLQLRETSEDKKIISISLPLKIITRVYSVSVSMLL